MQGTKFPAGVWGKAPLFPILQSAKRIKSRSQGAKRHLTLHPLVLNAENKPPRPHLCRKLQKIKTTLLRLILRNCLYIKTAAQLFFKRKLCSSSSFKASFTEFLRQVTLRSLTFLGCAPRLKERRWDCRPMPCLGIFPGNSYRNALRFLRFPISVTLNPAQRARNSNPPTPISASRRF